MDTSSPRAFVICRRANDVPRAPFTHEGYCCKMCSDPLIATDGGVEQIVHLRADTLCNRCGVLVLRAIGPAAVDLEISSAASEQSAHAPVKCDLMDLVARYGRAANTAGAHH